MILPPSQNMVSLFSHTPMASNIHSDHQNSPWKGKSLPGDRINTLKDNEIYSMADLSPLNGNMHETTRYCSVFELLDLLAPKSPRERNCAAPSSKDESQPPHQQSRSLFGDADEELALLLKYTHVAGGASLPSA